MPGPSARCWLAQLDTRLPMQVVEHNQRTALPGEWRMHHVTYQHSILHPVILLSGERILLVLPCFALLISLSRIVIVFAEEGDARQWTV